MRKLATIRRIKSLQPIPDRDRIELAKVDGWNVIVKKGEFNPGDLCVYCEIDSVLPEKEEFEFLRNKRFRIKTMKMAGVISQGITFPLSIMPEDIEPDEGTDVTELLGITKYEKDSKLPRFVHGPRVGRDFPSCIPKTDEERIQNIGGKHWEQIKEIAFYLTEKIDGSSATYALIDGVFHVCSRNRELDRPTEGKSCIYWETAGKYKIEKHMRLASLDNVAIQGEIFGPKIQGNPLKVEERQFQIFSAFNIAEQKYFDVQGLKEILFMMQPIEGVPLINPIGLVLEMCPQDYIIAMADGYSAINPKKLREGIVFASMDNVDSIYHPFGRVSFKAISNKWLLKHE